jgi:predicted nucleotidyltransferase component of viral defense system
LGEVLNFLPGKVIKQKRYNNTLLFRMESEVPPIVPIRLKIEINCFEHFTELGLIKMPFSMESSWFSGSCDITTYTLNELLGTKLRALYQRKKGRDLFDLYRALKLTDASPELILQCYRRYMSFSVSQPPTYKQFVLNMEGKIVDPEFIGDIKNLLRPEETYDVELAYQLVKMDILERLRN